MPELQISEYYRQSISRGTDTPLQHKISPRMKKKSFQHLFKIKYSIFPFMDVFQAYSKKKKKKKGGV